MWPKYFWHCEENQLSPYSDVRHGHCLQPNEKAVLWTSSFYFPALAGCLCRSLVVLFLFYILAIMWATKHNCSRAVEEQSQPPCHLTLKAIGILVVVESASRWKMIFMFFPFSALDFPPLVFSSNRGPNDAQSNFVVSTAFTDILMLWLLRFWTESFALQLAACSLEHGLQLATCNCNTRTWLYAPLPLSSGKSGKLNWSLWLAICSVDPLTSCQEDRKAECQSAEQGNINKARNA